MGKRYIGIAEETTYGTYVAPTNYIDVFSESFSATNQPTYIDGVGMRAHRRFVPGMYGLTGGFECVGDIVTIGWLLKMITGSVSTSGASDPYEHTFEETQDIYSYSICIGREVDERKITSFGASTLRLEWSGSEPMTAAVEGVAQKDTTAAIGTPTWDDEPVIGSVHCTFEWDDAAINVESGRLEISNNLAEDAWRLGTRFQTGLYPQRFEVDFSLDLAFENLDLWKDFWGAAAATEPQATLATHKLEFLMDTGVTNRTLDIALARVVIDSGNVPMSGRDRLIQTIEGKAIYDSTATNVIEAVLTNGEATYGA